ncbi:MAG TPA: PEP-CTERM sorting domain-containing protein [Pirellulales bacterium]|nr:PEP-CTERM sorting domain-containing protein [Pirellulales bacterium]
MLSTHRLFSVGATIFVGCVIVPVANGVTLQPGDVVVAANLGTSGNPDYALLEVNPTTGNRTVISDNTTGDGPSLNYGPKGSTTLSAYVSYEPGGSLLVTLESVNGVDLLSAIMRIDPSTGDRTLISDSVANSGSSIGPYTAARDFGNSILVTGNQGMALIDPATGNRTAFSTFEGAGFAVSGSNIYAAATLTTLGGIYNINAMTGVPTLVSGQGVGAGPSFGETTDVALNSAGNLFTTDNGPSLVEVNPVTGDRTIISSSVAGNPVGSGPALGLALTLAVGLDGSIFTPSTIDLTTATSAILSVDPLTGNRTILSDSTHGTGPAFNLLLASGITVVPNVPEPSTLALAALGGLLLVAWRRRK